MDGQCYVEIKFQELGFLSIPTPRVILGQVHTNVTCGTQTHTEQTACAYPLGYWPPLSCTLNHRVQLIPGTKMLLCPIIIAGKLIHLINSE